jgi:hypothetical protein
MRDGRAQRGSPVFAPAALCFSAGRDCLQRQSRAGRSGLQGYEGIERVQGVQITAYPKDANAKGGYAQILRPNRSDPASSLQVSSA